MATSANVTNDDAVKYTRHIEPPEQGGKKYVRCESCGSELLEDLGGKRRMIHSDGCPANGGR